jgi:ketosteroid isomerase-like protein
LIVWNQSTICTTRKVGKEVEMTTRETSSRVDLERIWRAFEGRDPETFIDLYADDAELQIVDCNTPPSSPMVLRGKEEIAGYWRDVFGRQMTHQMQQEVVGENRMAFNVACEYPDGTKVLATMRFDLREGKITRQVDVQAWDG